MAGFNEIDRVRTPKGQYVSASPLGGSGRPKRAIDTVPVPLVLVVVTLLGYGLLVVVRRNPVPYAPPLTRTSFHR